MKSFLIRFLFFIFLLVFIKQLILLFVPYHWGNPWYSSKVNYLKNEINITPDTYFFGSSRIYRQIDPNVFDSTFHSLTNEKRFSFNFGAPSTFCPQSYYLYNEFLESEISENTKLVFMELTLVNTISENLMHQERNTYWQNISDVRFVFSSFLNNSNMSLELKWNGIKNYSISYIENLFGFGHFGQQIMTEDYYKTSYLGSNKDGYYSLENQLYKTTDTVVRNDLIFRKNDFNLNFEKLQKRAQESIKNHEKNLIGFDAIHLNRIIRLIDESEKKGIELIFVIPPRATTKELINLSNSIPKRNRIDLSDARKHPQLYLQENYFDLGHLNSNGASILTKILVDEYLIHKKIR